MTPVCRIVVDVHEPRAKIASRLEALGANISIARLPIGDYDLGCGYLVERKTVLDLHLSLRGGRLWDQVGRLRRSAAFPCLLVEGVRLDVEGGVGAAAIRGACISVLRQGVAVLRTRDAEDSALWLCLLAHQTGAARLPRDRPKYAQRLKPRRDDVPAAMLAAVPGVSVATARRLLAHFGSVAAVVRADEEQLRAVRGVGQVRARALQRAFS